MRVCIPTIGDKGLDEQVGAHFGRVPTFTVVDTETKGVEVIQNISHHMGGSGYPPELMHKANVDVMLCTNLGGRAIGMFEELGITVYIGAQGTVKDAISMWEGDMLHMATDKNACSQHAYRGEKQGSCDRK